MSSTISTSSIADITFSFEWDSATGHHTEVYEAYGVDFWRDLLPEAMRDAMLGQSPGGSISVNARNNGIFPKENLDQRFRIMRRQFRESVRGTVVRPRIGRYYPRGLLKDLPGIYPQNVIPFRMIDIRNGSLHVDFNHPMAGKTIHLNATIRAVNEKTVERGGTMRDWSEVLGTGPGMQGRWQDRPTDYFSGHPFDRQDTAPDAAFYAKPRLVQHLDATARSQVANLYSRLVPSSASVLDLMSSWVSHLPEDLHTENLVGLGMNAEELDENGRLTERLVHDLNRDPSLPFTADSFDAVICTVSVEYLTRPLEVFDELARVLRPGGIAIMTFSNRWFPPKAVRIWTELHEFERMGLVMEYFNRTGQFVDIETSSLRGMPRPYDDKYFPEMPYADPVYAVWGRKNDPGKSIH